MSSPTPPPIPVSKKSRTGWIVAGVIAVVLLLPVLFYLGTRGWAAVLLSRIIPPPMEKKVDFLPSMTNEASLRQAEMEEEIRKLKDSLDEEITPFGSLDPAPE